MDKIKSWMFPGVITVLGALLWNDIREIKTDVKALIAQSNIDKTRIDGLEREVYGFQRQASNTPSLPIPDLPQSNDVLFVRPQEYYVKKKPYRPQIASNN